AREHAGPFRTLQGAREHAHARMIMQALPEGGARCVPHASEVWPGDAERVGSQQQRASGLLQVRKLVVEWPAEERLRGIEPPKGVADRPASLVCLMVTAGYLLARRRSHGAEGSRSPQPPGAVVFLEWTGRRQRPRVGRLADSRSADTKGARRRISQVGVPL